MERVLLQQLLAWKQNPRRLPLILRGPRQVGKSYLIDYFGKNHFKQLVTINFELQPKAKDYFNDLNPDQIINQIELNLGVELKEDQETLLFLDEIQECPQALLALRYFKEMKPGLPIIAAGSLLEFILQAPDFRMPVGRIQYLYCRPFSFQEYLKARGFTQLVSFLTEVTLEEGIPASVHEHLLTLLSEYLIVGGMPAAVQEFQISQRFQATQLLQEGLLATYKDDFGRYATHSQYRYLQSIFERAPGLVGEKFNFSKIDPQLRSRELKPALECLKMAGLINLIYQTAASGLPLINTRKEDRYKLLFVDVGLMVKATGLSSELLLRKDFFALNRGAVMEQFVGQELLAYAKAEEKTDLYYWEREKVSSSAEVDYVVAIDNRLIPIEVKAGKAGRLRSLQVFLQERDISLGIKISIDPLALESTGKILSLPLYMVEALPRMVRSILDT